LKIGKSGKRQKKEYYTFLFMPGPNERVRALSVSKSAVKTALLFISAVISLSFYSVYKVYDYNSAKDRELQSVRNELMRQKTQVQDFALSLLDYKRQMLLLRDLDTKLRRVVSLAPRNRAQQVLGIGGPDELGLRNLAAMGEKGQEEALREMRGELSQLKGAASRQEVSLQLLLGYFEDKRSLSASTPSIWPVRGWITSPFGNRLSPFSGIIIFHEGLDIAAQTGSPVMAPAEGVVIKAGFDAGYGNMVEISHGYGFRTLFAHNSRITVKTGQRVKRGDIICYVGDTGSSTGPHLHYEVRRNGLPVNPMKYMN
jgi:murein DD-endopeptidase MepM/ murein hydrolase activator NlpD